MSFRIKNIWKDDGVSRSEYEQSLIEFDTALQNITNNIETIKKSNQFIRIGSYTETYSNLNIIDVGSALHDPTINYGKPLTISFIRTNTTGKELGVFSGTIIFRGDDFTNNAYVVSTNMYFDRGGTNNVEIGDMCSIVIKYSQGKWILVTQCWNLNDRIKSISIRGWTL